MADLNEEVSRLLSRSNCGSDDYPYCLQQANVYNSLAESMSLYWAKKYKNWAIIAPRSIFHGTQRKEILTNRSSQLFITPVPLPGNTAEITIKEISGRAKTRYVICKVDRNGNYTNLKSGWFNEVSSQRSTSGESRKHTLEGIAGHFINVFVENKEMGKQFEYGIRLG